MSSAEDRSRAAFLSIGAQAKQSNLDRVAQLQDAVVRALDGHLDEAGRLAARRLAHTIAGSAGTFGFGQATGPAHHLEDLFAATPARPAELADACRWLDEIRAALASDPADDDY